MRWGITSAALRRSIPFVTFAASDLPLRLYTLSKQMGVPLPEFSRDEVTNFMVTEFVMLKGLQHEADMAKKQRREEWKRRPVGSGTPEMTM